MKGLNDCGDKAEDSVVMVKTEGLAAGSWLATEAGALAPTIPTGHGHAPKQGNHLRSHLSAFLLFIWFSFVGTVTVFAGRAVGRVSSALPLPAVFCAHVSVRRLSGVRPGVEPADEPGGHNVFSTSRRPSTSRPLAAIVLDPQLRVDDLVDPEVNGARG